MIKNSVIKLVSIFLVICFANLSCSSSYNRSETLDIERYYKRLNSTSKGYSGTVFLISGESYDVWSINVSNDLTTWIDSNTLVKTTVSTSDINKVYFKNHFKGGIGGFVIGFLGGLTAGYIVDMIAEGEASYGIIGGAILGSGLGLLVGGILGDRKEYIIVPVDKE